MRENLEKRAVSETAYVADTAERYDRVRFTSRAGKAMHEQEFRCLTKALRYVQKDARVLEVGCGTGRLLLEARELGYRVDGLDASPDMLDILQSKRGGRFPDLRLELSEAAKTPFDNNSYDLVYAIRVLSPTGSVEYALRTVTEMMRITKPGGFVLVEFQNFYRPRLGAARKPSTRLTPRQVADQGRDAGGRVIRHLGAFFLSMQAYWVTPNFMIALLSVVDRALSTLFPRLCSRSYVLFQKAA